MKKAVILGIPLGLLFCVLFACNIQSYVLNKDSSECKQECSDDLQHRRSLCDGKYSDAAELKICNDDAYDRYMRCLETCK